ncbi:MAG: DNA-binding response OmpR family regulator, partial [Pseudohongiellaceae bacterium]
DELLARMTALRRLLGTVGKSSQNTLNFAGLELLSEERIALLNGTELVLQLIPQH